MKIKRFIALSLSFLLTVATSTHPCTTFYSDAGDVQFCVNNAEPEDQNDCPFCGQEDCNNDWTKLPEEDLE